jgi:hypothetical protein
MNEHAWQQLCLGLFKQLFFLQIRVEALQSLLMSKDQISQAEIDSKVRELGDHLSAQLDEEFGKLLKQQETDRLRRILEEHEGIKQ